MNDRDLQRLLDQQEQMLRYMRKRLDEGVEQWHKEQERLAEDEEIGGVQMEPMPPGK